MSAPTLETDRLTLRAWRDDDLDAYASVCADPDVMRYIADGSTRTRAEASEQITSLSLQWDEHGFGLWCAADRGSGMCLGFVGLAIPDFLPEIMPAVEIGWRLGRDSWGKGLATEGARATVEFAFGDLGLERIVSVARPENTRSWRVMEKIGMRRERVATHPKHGFDVVVYELTSSG